MKIVTMLNGVISPGAEGVEVNNFNKDAVSYNSIKVAQVVLEYNETLPDVLVIKCVHNKANVIFDIVTNDKVENIEKVKVTSLKCSKNVNILVLKPGGSLRISQTDTVNNKKVKVTWRWDGKTLNEYVFKTLKDTIDIDLLIKQANLP